MMQIRRSAERGHANHGWLDSHHTFSFANYHDPDFMGFRALRVINDDRVAGGAGFPTHPHRDMEIISYVVEGALEHKDSMGNGSVIARGDVQRMRAGTGVSHSEYNHDPDSTVHFLQIWIEPEARGLAPSYAQRDFSAERKGALRLTVSRDGRDDSLQIAQDVDMYAAELSDGQAVHHSLPSDRFAWVQVVRGAVSVNGERLETGDGAALRDVGQIDIESAGDSELILFDLA